ncbi:sodium-dependent bicarbonate transport family permease [Rhodohalobacter sulfatireducens]|uniref:Sodium-dependent bicarbonate transport family permease n=1 Tax=Rhodohalobacter sulfatireducens TaxID=2911366 RepID=A0ABS9KCA3_9BACT|nr:sodium-dependent bicarbonate transport family permease [Rhodohalobacter sulfatireducens]MCG2588489.1 sodium-dependent bicarbonate transport family permease [Rhodohalobacter sulfatireducens]MDR9364477.1 sodium-dependent bicarbonate transport family permease [Balneolaceae bacterium]MDR9407391.1 sodium-dependent bicarbonate transport family permease [Balneolaceae bacterium]
MDTIITNLTSPVVMAFVMGIMVKAIKSDLEFPQVLYKSISIYLLVAIGLKGGVELSKTPFSEFILPASATIFMGIITPIIAFVIIRYLGKVDLDNSAGVAAHYGSVSMVTFLASISYLQTEGLEPEGFMPTLLALLEIPGIIVALMIPLLQKSSNSSFGKAMHEVVTGGSIVLLLGGLIIGFIAGPVKFQSIEPFFVNGFQGALFLFLLELGMVTARRFRDLKKVGFFIVAFGILVPILHGFLAILIGFWSGLSLAGTVVFATMVSSASYIAAPAAVRIALPKASPTIYLTASLGITFPFNITIGIPLYYAISLWIGG